MKIELISWKCIASSSFISSHINCNGTLMMLLDNGVRQTHSHIIPVNKTCLSFKHIDEATMTNKRALHFIMNVSHTFNNSWEKEKNLHRAL